MSYRAAVIGCGRIGCEFDDTRDRRAGLVYSHAGAYYDSPYTKLVGLCDIEATKLNKYTTKYETVGYNDYRTMLSEAAPEIVSICTGPSLRYEIIEACVRHGVKAIYCEKPLDNSTKEAQRSVDLCASHGVILVVNHMRRFSEFHCKLADAFRKETLGSMVAAGATYSGGIYNSGTHVVDLLRLYFGEVEWVSAHYSQQTNANKDDPNIDAFLGMRNGTTISLQAHGIPGIFDVDVVTTEYKLHINAAALFNDQPFITGAKRCENKYFSGSYKFVYNFDILEEMRALGDSTNNDYMMNGVKYLVDCLDRDRAITSPCGQDGLEALRIIEKIHESARTNGARLTIEKGQNACQS